MQGAAAKRNSSTMTAAVRARRTSLKTLRGVLCFGQLSAQRREEPTMPEVAVYMFNSRGVPEMSKKMMVKLTDELRELASEEEHIPEPSAASTGCVHAAGQGAVRCRSVRAQLARRTRAKQEHYTAPSQLASRIPTVGKLGAGAGRLAHGPDQQIADETSVRDQSHREDRPAEQRPRREDGGLRPPYLSRVCWTLWLGGCVMTPCPRPRQRLRGTVRPAATRQRSQQVSIRS